MVEDFSKKYWLDEIINTSEIIVQAMSALKDNIALLSSLVLPKFRIIVDSIACYIRENELNISKKETSYEKIEKSILYVGKVKEYKFLQDLHNEFNVPNHHTAIGDYAIRLMFSYVLKLVDLKDFFYKKYNIEILNGIENLSMDSDNAFNDYYRKILDVIVNCYNVENNSNYDYYYIQKKKPIYVNHDLFYEYTLTNALDHNNKFDRFIVFSKINMFDNYAIQGKIINESIEMFGKKINVVILTDYKVSIRLCELEHIGNIFGWNNKFTKTKEYYKLMDYIQLNRVSLSRIIQLSDDKYNEFEKVCFISAKTSSIQLLIRDIREFIFKGKKGKNVALYLLSMMRNEVIKKQIDEDSNSDFYGLKLKKKCLPFEQTPYSASLCQHIPLMKYIMDSIPYDEHYYEMINRVISKNSIENNSLYTPVEELKFENDIDLVIEKYNSIIPGYHPGRKVFRFNKYVYLEENESNTRELLKSIKPFIHNGGLKEYGNYVNENISKLDLDDVEKENTIKKMFLNNSLFTIYGPAGTGKSTLANYVINVLDDYSVLCIANTNPAVENMKSKITRDDVAFSTVYSFLSKKWQRNFYDILIVDECSTISTKDIYAVLQKIDCSAVIFMGDIYQIESIKFGNWFEIIREFLPKDSYVDLTKQHRTKNSILQNLWTSVRDLNISNVRTSLSFNKISHELDEDVLNTRNEDEIILCLNYDGIFGINNINKLLQISNETNVMVRWKQYIFKKGDPILFLENERFNGILYNNLKGRIEDVYEDTLSIYFTIKVYKHIDKIDSLIGEFNLLSADGEDSIISFKVNKYNVDSYDNDSDEMNKIPFQIAYAVSIHKAQGLEYNSVKVIIPNEVDESISLNVFYTAITRAKEELRIYWTKESQEKILQSFEKKNCHLDASILINRYPELKIK